MKRSLRRFLFGLLLTASTSAAFAIDSATAPRPIPLTRPEMKKFLEDMKGRKERIPLPALTDADKEKLGERANSYETRLRYHYMPGGDTQSARPGGGGVGGAGGGNAPGGAGRTGGGGGGGGFGGFGRDQDPDMTLDYAFKTQLFWIVSRTNNCQYCLGHQESKLLAAGMTEDEIAALDGDWSQHKPALQVAYAFARKTTYEPHRLNDDDIAGLRKHYTDKQILEMILSIAGNNSINRWKEGAGIPQSSNGGNFGSRGPGGERTPGAGGATEKPAAEKSAAAKPTTDKPAADAAGAEKPTVGRAERRGGGRPGAGETAGGEHSYLTPTSPQFEKTVTKVAPIKVDAKTGAASGATISERPPLESRAETERALAAAAKREPRLPLVDEAKTRELLPEGFPTGSVPQWTRLLATFPTSAKSRIASIRSAEERSELSPLVKAQVAWIIARQDRAWYAAGQARARLRELGQTDDQIFALDGDWSSFTPAERATFTVARKLATTPVVLTDADTDEAVKQIGPRLVVQLISYVTNRASFDRITETAGLRID